MRVIPCLLEAFAKAPDADILKRTTTLLENIGQPAVSGLCDLSSHMDHIVRRRCVQLLGAIRSEDAIDNLALTLADMDNIVRGLTAEALANIGGQRVVDVLISTLRSGTPKECASAIDALGRLNETDAIPEIVTHIMNYTRVDHIRTTGMSSGGIFPYVSSIAQNTLRSMGTREALEALKNANVY